MSYKCDMLVTDSTFEMSVGCFDATHSLLWNINYCSVSWALRQPGPDRLQNALRLWSIGRLWCVMSSSVPHIRTMIILSWLKRIARHEINLKENILFHANTDDNVLFRFLFQFYFTCEVTAHGKKRPLFLPSESHCNYDPHFYRATHATHFWCMQRMLYNSAV